MRNIDRTYYWANYSDQTAGWSPQMVVVRECSHNPLNSGLGIIVICPDLCHFCSNAEINQGHASHPKKWCRFFLGTGTIQPANLCQLQWVWKMTFRLDSDAMFVFFVDGGIWKSSFKILEIWGCFFCSQGTREVAPI